MKKHPYLLILLTTVLCLKGFSQALPPTLNSYTDSIGSTSLVLYINYTANDTGVIKAQVFLDQGTGHTVYDSTYSLPASGGNTGTAQLNIGPISNCTGYQLSIDMSNSQAQGPLQNPLFEFTSLCVSGITNLNENNYSVIASLQGILVKAVDVPATGFIEIYDVTGRQVLNTPFDQSTQQILFNQNAGIYLLRITGNGQSLYTTRFVNY